MKTKKICVLPYDPQWKLDFEDICRELAEVLGGLALRIEHVGSTAVEGMSAKPCIDVDVIMTDYTVFDTVVHRLGAIGYVHEGDLGIKGREAFCYTDKSHLLKHHLYVCPRNSEELYRHITFRNFLRANPDAVRVYSAVKEEAARLYPNDMDGYIAHKSPCIAELYARCGLA